MVQGSVINQVLFLSLTFVYIFSEGRGGSVGTCMRLNALYVWGVLRLIVTWVITSRLQIDLSPLPNSFSSKSTSWTFSEKTQQRNIDYN